MATTYEKTQVEVAVPGKEPILKPAIKTNFTPTEKIELVSVLLIQKERIEKEITDRQAKLKIINDKLATK